MTALIAPLDEKEALFRIVVSEYPAENGCPLWGGLCEVQRKNHCYYSAIDVRVGCAFSSPNLATATRSSQRVDLRRFRSDGYRTFPVTISGTERP